jgi:hypothetical protein
VRKHATHIFYMMLLLLFATAAQSQVNTATPPVWEELNQAQMVSCFIGRNFKT